MSVPSPIPITELAQALGLAGRELVSLVGGGGKTTALFALGRQLCGPCVLTTTTKMGRDRTGGYRVLLSPTDEELDVAVAGQGSVLVWRQSNDDKALGVEPGDCDRWLAQGKHVVVEADGSRRMPFKAPMPYEPVVPVTTTILVACVGADALNAPVVERCQRPETVADVAGCGVTDRLTPARLGTVLMSSRGSRKGCPDRARFAVLVNQVTAVHGPYVAELAQCLGAETPLIAVAPFRSGESPE